MKLLFGKPSASSTYSLIDNLNIGSLLTLPTKTVGNVLVATANAVNTVLDIVSPIGLLGNALLGKPFEIVHKAGDTIIDAVTDVIGGIGEGLGATTPYRDTHYDNEWVNKSVNLENILDVVPDTLGNLLVGGTNIVNDFQNVFTPVGQVANDLLGSPFTEVHKSADTLADLISDVVAGVGEKLGSNIEQAPTHLENEWAETGFAAALLPASTSFVTIEEQPISF